MDYSFFAWVAVILLGLQLVPFVLRRSPWKKQPLVRNVNKYLAKAHPYLGCAALVAAGIHAYMVFGRIVWHTGTLLFLIVATIALFGVLFKTTKNRTFLKIHRLVVLLALVAFGIHFFVPGLFS